MTYEKQSEALIKALAALEVAAETSSDADDTEDAEFFGAAADELRAAFPELGTRPTRSLIE